jgi:hypothetical protein
MIRWIDDDWCSFTGLIKHGVVASCCMFFPEILGIIQLFSLLVFLRTILFVPLFGRFKEGFKRWGILGPLDLSSGLVTLELLGLRWAKHVPRILQSSVTCSIVKTGYMLYGHPSPYGNPCDGHIKPPWMDWWPPPSVTTQSNFLSMAHMTSKTKQLAPMTTHKGERKSCSSGNFLGRCACKRQNPRPCARLTLEMI